MQSLTPPTLEEIIARSVVDYEARCAAKFAVAAANETSRIEAVRVKFDAPLRPFVFAAGSAHGNYLYTLALRDCAPIHFFCNFRGEMAHFAGTFKVGNDRFDDFIDALAFAALNPTPEKPAHPAKEAKTSYEIIAEMIGIAAEHFDEGRLDQANFRIQFAIAHALNEISANLVDR